MIPFVFAVFASYRITRLITHDDIFDFVREAWWKRYPSDTKPGLLISCPYCVGVYVSALLTIGLVIAIEPFQKWWALWLLWPAIAGAQSLLNAIDERLSRD